MWARWSIPGGFCTKPCEEEGRVLAMGTSGWEMGNRPRFFKLRIVPGRYPSSDPTFGWSLCPRSQW